MDVVLTADEAVDVLRTTDRLPWPAEEVEAVLCDSLEALELLVDLDSRSDDELRTVLGLEDGSLAPLATLVHRCGADDRSRS